MPRQHCGGPSHRSGWPRPGRRIKVSAMLRLPSFTYRQPKTLRAALAMKADAGPEGSYVAGGTDLYPNMKRRQQEPRTVISLMGVPELGADGRIGGSAAGMTIGSCITLAQLSANSAIRQSAPAVAEAAA